MFVYIISTYSAAVGRYIYTCRYMVTYLTTPNTNNFKSLHVGFAGCMNVTYDPDDFTFIVVLGINDRVLYKNTLSGK